VLRYKSLATVPGIFVVKNVVMEWSSFVNASKVNEVIGYCGACLRPQSFSPTEDGKFLTCGLPTSRSGVECTGLVIVGATKLVFETVPSSHMSATAK